MRFIRTIFVWVLLATVSVAVPSFAQPGAGTFHSLLSQDSQYDPDYNAVLVQAIALGYTIPGASERATQNQMVLDMKAAGIWSELDIFYPMLTNIDFATLNWIAPTLFQLTLVNSPTYSTATGFQGNGTTSYLTTGWAPDGDGVNYTLDDAAIGGLNTNDLNNNSVLYGTYQGVNVNSAYLQPRSAGNLIARTNQNGSTTVANANSIGRYHQQRTGPAAVEVFKDGSSITTLNNGSFGPSINGMHILAMNANGSITNLGTRQIRYMWAGASLDTLEATFDAILATYYP